MNMVCLIRRLPVSGGSRFLVFCISVVSCWSSRKEDQLAFNVFVAVGSSLCDVPVGSSSSFLSSLISFSPI